MKKRGFWLLLPVSLFVLGCDGPSASTPLAESPKPVAGATSQDSANLSAGKGLDFASKKEKAHAINSYFSSASSDTTAPSVAIDSSTSLSEIVDTALEAKYAAMSEEELLKEAREIIKSTGLDSNLREGYDDTDIIHFIDTFDLVAAARHFPGYDEGKAYECRDLYTYAITSQRHAEKLCTEVAGNQSPWSWNGQWNNRIDPVAWANYRQWHNQGVCGSCRSLTTNDNVKLIYGNSLLLLKQIKKRAKQAYDIAICGAAISALAAAATANHNACPEAFVIPQRSIVATIKCAITRATLGYAMVHAVKQCKPNTPPHDEL